MDELLDALETSFEDAGFEVDGVSRNRDQVRIVVVDEDAAIGQLRSLVTDTVTEGSVLGLNVTTESVEGTDGTSTVVSFRYRS